MIKQITSKPFYNSEIPSDWEVMEFGEFAETEKGKYVPVENENLRCLELEHFDQGTGFLGWINSPEQKSTKNKFKKGQVLFGKLRPYLQKYWLAEYDGVCSSEVWVLNSKNRKCSNEFLFRLVQSNLTPPVAFTRWLPVYISFCAILLIYAMVLVLKALINERLGANFLTISVLLGVGIFGYDVFAYEGFFTYNPIVFSAGYIIIFTLMAVVLLLHLGIIKSKPQPSSKLTFNDLYKEDNPLTKY